MKHIFRIFFITLCLISYSATSVVKDQISHSEDKRTSKEESFMDKTIRVIKELTYWDVITSPKLKYGIFSYFTYKEPKPEKDDIHGKNEAIEKSLLADKNIQDKSKNNISISQNNLAQLALENKVDPAKPIPPRLPEDNILIPALNAQNTQAAIVEPNKELADAAKPVAPRLPDDDVQPPALNAQNIQAAIVEPNKELADAAKSVAPRLPDDDIILPEDSVNHKSSSASKDMILTEVPNNKIKELEHNDLSKQIPVNSSGSEPKLLAEADKINITSISQLENDILNEVSHNSNSLPPSFHQPELKQEADITLPNKSTVDAIDPELAAYVIDELAMLVLPEDDVVLGEITFNARMMYVDEGSYINEFWKAYNKVQTAPTTKLINEFIHAVKRPAVILELEEAKTDSIYAIGRNDISSLRAILNHATPNLVNLFEPDFNLLLEAINADNYDSVYYLIMRGANVNKVSSEGDNMMDAAQQNDSESIIWLLKRAGASSS